MLKIYTPKALTESQINDVIVMSLTGEQHEMLEYNEDTKVITDFMGAVGYLSEDCAVGVNEFGIVMLFDNLDELLKNWRLLK